MQNNSQEKEYVLCWLKTKKTKKSKTKQKLNKNKENISKILLVDMTPVWTLEKSHIKKI